MRWSISRTPQRPIRWKPEQPGDEQRSPRQLGYGPQSLTVFVDDVDAHYVRAKAAGTKIFEEPHETEYGNISTRLRIWMDTTAFSRGTRRTAAQRSGVVCGEAVARYRAHAAAIRCQLLVSRLSEKFLAPTFYDWLVNLSE